LFWWVSDETGLATEHRVAAITLTIVASLSLPLIYQGQGGINCSLVIILAED